MSCNPSFPKTFPLDCLRELAKSMTSPPTSVAAFREFSRKAAWTYGCLITYISPEELDPSVESYPSAMEDDELCAHCSHAFVMGGVQVVRSASLLDSEQVQLALELCRRAMNVRPVMPDQVDDQVDDGDTE